MGLYPMRYYEVLFYDGTVSRSRKTWATDEYEAIEKVKNSPNNNVHTVHSVWTRVLHIEAGEDGLVSDV
jgi:hypothetical protein